MTVTEEPVPEHKDAPELMNKSVVKATLLLRELGRYPRGATVTDLAQSAGLSRPTAFRLLLSLEHGGFVERTENIYTLGWELLRLGRISDPALSISARIQPILEALAENLSEATSFVLVKGDLDYDIICEASASRYLSVSSVHQRYPLHATAFGKVLLAELPDDRIKHIFPEELPALTEQTITDREELLKELHHVRQQGYAVLDNELEEGLFAVAVGCRDSQGRLFGIVTATGPEQRMKAGRRLSNVVESMRVRAAEIARILG